MGVGGVGGGVGSPKIIPLVQGACKQDPWGTVLSFSQHVFWSKVQALHFFCCMQYWQQASGLLACDVLLVKDPLP